MFTYKFAAILRMDRTNQIITLSATAETEKEARRKFAKNYILFFAARFYTTEVTHA